MPSSSYQQPCRWSPVHRKKPGDKDLTSVRQELRFASSERTVRTGIVILIILPFLYPINPLLILSPRTRKVFQCEFLAAKWWRGTDWAGIFPSSRDFDKTLWLIPLSACLRTFTQRGWCECASAVQHCTTEQRPTKGPVAWKASKPSKLLKERNLQQLSK